MKGVNQFQIQPRPIVVSQFDPAKAEISPELSPLPPLSYYSSIKNPMDSLGNEQLTICNNKNYVAALRSSTEVDAEIPYHAPGSMNMSRGYNYEGSVYSNQSKGKQSSVGDILQMRPPPTTLCIIEDQDENMDSAYINFTCSVESPKEALLTPVTRDHDSTQQVPRSSMQSNRRRRIHKYDRKRKFLMEMQQS